MGGSVDMPVNRRCYKGRREKFFAAAIIAAVLAGALAAPRAAEAAAPASQGGSSESVLTPPAAELTRTLLALGSQYDAAPPARRAELVRQMLDLAATRQQLLQALVADDPCQVLDASVPADQRRALPAAIQALLEADAALEGELEVMVEDGPYGHAYRYFVRVGAERLSLHFAADVPELLSGSRVRVRGVRVGDALALDSGASSSSFEVLSVALPNTFGEQRTAVILVTFQDNPTQPYTRPYAQDVVFNTTSDFDWEISYGQTWLTGDVYGWYTIPLDSTACDPNGIVDYAQAAARAAGADLSGYQRFVYGFPTNACTWWGLGTVGGNPSHAWIKGSFTLRVVGHEMGHNLGLYHARSLDCGSAVVGGSCTYSEYGDTLDIMGSASGHFSAFQKEQLGWLGYQVSPSITTVDASGTYALEPYQIPSSGPKALKILKSTDPVTAARTWYYVEYRRALGFDSFLSSNANVLGGVVVHTGSEASGREIYLLDMTPMTSSFSDPALAVGGTFTDAEAGVTITPIAADSNGAAVAVSFGGQSCVRVSPTVSLSPAQSQWVRPGTPVDYTVTVVSRDGGGCATATFDLQAGVPSGWSASFGSAALAIAPGASATTTLRLTSPAGAADGVYPLTATATNRLDALCSASASATYAVASALAVNISTDRPSYTRKQAATIAATVRASGSAVAGANVVFTITKPNGAVMTQSATSSSSGTATMQFRPKRTDPSGTYAVRADATTAASSGWAATSFVLQ